MGHLLIGTLPQTLPWRRVIHLIASGADVAAAAAPTVTPRLFRNRLRSTGCCIEVSSLSDVMARPIDLKTRSVACLRSFDAWKEPLQSV